MDRKKAHKRVQMHTYAYTDKCRLLFSGEVHASLLRTLLSSAVTLWRPLSWTEKGEKCLREKAHTQYTHIRWYSSVHTALGSVFTRNYFLCAYTHILCVNIWFGSAITIGFGVILCGLLRLYLIQWLNLLFMPKGQPAGLITWPKNKRNVTHMNL